MIHLEEWIDYTSDSAEDKVHRRLVYQPPSIWRLRAGFEFVDFVSLVPEQKM